MLFNALEITKTWYCVCCAITGVPLEIWTSKEACVKAIEERVAKGKPSDLYIIQKITIDSFCKVL